MIEQWLHSIAGGMMVVVIAEAVFALVRKTRRDRETSDLRKFLRGLEESMIHIRKSGRRTFDDMKMLASFRSGLRNARRLVMCSEHLRGNQRFEVMWMLEEMLDLTDYICSKKQLLRPEFYEAFFGELKKNSMAEVLV